MHLGAFQVEVLRFYKKSYRVEVTQCVLTEDLEALPKKFKDRYDKTRVKLRKNQRDARKRKLQQSVENQTDSESV